jgi:hypothetical protein
MMRAVSGAILTLAGAVFAQTARGDYYLGYLLIFIGLAVCIYGLARPER